MRFRNFFVEKEGKHLPLPTITKPLGNQRMRQAGQIMTGIPTITNVQAG